MLAELVDRVVDLASEAEAEDGGLIRRLLFARSGIHAGHHERPLRPFRCFRQSAAGNRRRDRPRRFILEATLRGNVIESEYGGLRPSELTHLHRRLIVLERFGFIRTGSLATGWDRSAGSGRRLPLLEERPKLPDTRRLRSDDIILFADMVIALDHLRLGRFELLLKPLQFLDQVSLGLGLRIAIATELQLHDARVGRQKLGGRHGCAQLLLLRLGPRGHELLFERLHVHLEHGLGH